MCCILGIGSSAGGEAMRALRKRLACAGGKREQFSPGCVWESIASIPIPRSSLCFFLWRQRKKGDFETIIQNESLPPFELLVFLGKNYYITKKNQMKIGTNV